MCVCVCVCVCACVCVCVYQSDICCHVNSIIWLNNLNLRNYFKKKLWRNYKMLNSDSIKSCKQPICWLKSENTLTPPLQKVNSLSPMVPSNSLGPWPVMSEVEILVAVTVRNPPPKWSWGQQHSTAALNWARQSDSPDPINRLRMLNPSSYTNWCPPNYGLNCITAALLQGWLRQ